MKQKRHTAILELIEKYEIETQEDLADFLNKEGYNVTQATISRDIKALRLIKTIGSKGTYKYTKADKGKADDDSKNMIVQSTLGVNYINNIVLIKTLSGMANGVAVIIDSMNMPEVMGTVAGDDTIICITKTEEDAIRFVAKINALIQ